jgi:hypothetical protein
MPFLFEVRLNWIVFLVPLLSANLDNRVAYWGSSNTWTELRLRITALGRRKSDDSLRTDPNAAYTGRVSCRYSKWVSCDGIDLADGVAVSGKRDSDPPLSARCGSNHDGGHIAGTARIEPGRGSTGLGSWIVQIRIVGIIQRVPDLSDVLNWHDYAVGLVG